jgi:SAM-dependent methyltransferase
MTSPRNPQAEIAADNPWYVEDQFAVQLGSPAFRAVVENRWRIFSAAIDDWIRAAGAPPARLLDAGCGDGINLSYFARLGRERRWSTRLVGADYSPLRVDRARAVDASLIRTSVTALGFADRTFDVIICNQVLEHVPDDRLAFGELRRVLRPGGLLLVGVPNEGSPLGILRNHVLQRSILRTTDHVNMYNQQLLRDRLSEAGLQVTRIIADGFFVPHTRLHSWLNAAPLVRRSLNAITSLAPSCAAGLLATAVRPI